MKSNEWDYSLKEIKVAQTTLKASTKDYDSNLMGLQRYCVF